MARFPDLAGSGSQLRLNRACSKRLSIEPARTSCNAAGINPPCQGSYSQSPSLFFPSPSPRQRRGDCMRRQLAPPHLFFLHQSADAKDCVPSETRSADWAVDFSADDYVRLLHTFSDHIRLGRVRLAALTEDIRTVINGSYGGVVTRPYRSVLRMGRRTRQAGDAEFQRSWPIPKFERVK